VKSTIKILRPSAVWHPRVGAPPGNCNALKTGKHTAERRALRSAVARWRRTTNALIKRAKMEMIR
jgi:hypothetical protein